MGGIHIEMVFRHLIVFVGYKRQTLKQVFLYLLVCIKHSATRIVDMHIPLHFGHVRHTLIQLTGFCILINRREDIDKQEMVVSTDEESLTLGSTQLGREFGIVSATNLIYRLKSMVDRSNRSISARPE